jgi:hypothetical protein
LVSDLRIPVHQKLLQETDGEGGGRIMEEHKPLKVMDRRVDDDDLEIAVDLTSKTQQKSSNWWGHIGQGWQRGAERKNFTDFGLEWKYKGKRISPSINHQIISDKTLEILI